MTLEICIAINNEAGVSHVRLPCRTPGVRVVDAAYTTARIERYDAARMSRKYFVFPEGYNETALRDPVTFVAATVERV